MVIHKDYPCHPRNCQRGRAQPVSFLVLHYVGATGGAEANVRYYGSTPSIGASAHYFVDHGPAAGVWESVPEGDTAWHVGAKKYRHPRCRNANSIGIEMCCRQRSDGSWYIDRSTVDAAVELSRDIMARYHIPVGNVLRHYDVTGKQCLPLDNTELLTKDGWKKLSDIKIGDVVAQYSPEDDHIQFGEVLDVVEPHISDVVSCRGLEATDNHRMYAKPNCINSKKFRVIEYGDMIAGGRQYRVKNGAVYPGAGLDLTDNELRLLVWVQGDGHYMKYASGKVHGLEFHLKKQRKIDTITKLLDDCAISYTVCKKSDGSTAIRVSVKADITYRSVVSNVKLTPKRDEKVRT